MERCSNCGRSVRLGVLVEGKPFVGHGEGVLLTRLVTDDWFCSVLCRPCARRLGWVKSKR